MVLFALAMLSYAVLAIPGMSHKFYGSVLINNQPAPDGTVIRAKINDVVVATTTTSQGKFGYPLYSFGVDDPDNNRAGKVVKFFVNDIDTGVAVTFCNACFNLCDMYTPNCAPLLLSVTISSQQGGTTGGGRGGGTTEQPSQTTNQTVTQQTCQERWVCSEWSECINGVQTRTCVDQNNCGTNNNEPFTSQPCSSEQRKEEKSSQGISGITGFFALISNPIYTLGLILVIIAILALILTFIFSRRKK